MTSGDIHFFQHHAMHGPESSLIIKELTVSMKVHFSNHKDKSAWERQINQELLCNLEIFTEPMLKAVYCTRNYE